jgi:glucokinase
MVVGGGKQCLITRRIQLFLGESSMNEHSGPLVLGIDLGGTKILSAVSDSEGKMVSRDHSITPALKGTETVIQSITESAHRALEQARVDIAQLDAIGVGAPGLSNPETGVLFTSPNLRGWWDVPLRDILEEKLGKKTFLMNDANAAALGEFYFGAARGAHDFIYVTISTGIGGGIFIDGKIYTGTLGAAGEVGHMTIDDKGPLCNCGNRGCWETLASGTALAREARQRIKQGAKTLMLDSVGGGIEKVTAQVIHAAAVQGDSLAKELISQTGYYVGVGLANLINIFNPELIVIGGGLSNMGDLLLGPAHKVAEERAFAPSFKSVRLVPAQLGRNSGVLGAAAFAFQQMKNRRGK